jgi:hypothetical protein
MQWEDAASLLLYTVLVKPLYSSAINQLREQVAIKHDMNTHEQSVVAAGLRLMVWAHGRNDSNRLEIMHINVCSEMVSSLQVILKP